jgi:hypothetical protein
MVADSTVGANQTAKLSSLKLLKGMDCELFASTFLLLLVSSSRPVASFTFSSCCLIHLLQLLLVSSSYPIVPYITISCNELIFFKTTQQQKGVGCTRQEVSGNNYSSYLSRLRFEES